MPARARCEVSYLFALVTKVLPGLVERAGLASANATCRLLRPKRCWRPCAPRDIAGKTRRRLATEEIADLVAVDAKLKKIKAELKAAVLESGSTLMDIYGVGPAGAAWVLADVGDIARFVDRNRFASWTGTAP